MILDILQYLGAAVVLWFGIVLHPGTFSDSQQAQYQEVSPAGRLCISVTSLILLGSALLWATHIG